MGGSAQLLVPRSPDEASPSSLRTYFPTGAQGARSIVSPVPQGRPGGAHGGGAGGEVEPPPAPAAVQVTSGHLPGCGGQAASGGSQAGEEVAATQRRGLPLGQTRCVDRGWTGAGPDSQLSRTTLQPLRRCSCHFPL